MGNIAVIDGTPVNVVAGGMDVVNQIGQRSTGTLNVWSNRGVHWKKGAQVQVFDTNSNQVYAGYVNKDIATKGTRQATGFLEHTLTLMDNCWRADKRYVFYSAINTSAGAIFKALIANYLAVEGCTYTPTSIAAGPTIIQVVWNGSKKVSDAFTWLASQSGFWWNIDMNGVVWFQPYGGVPAPFVLDGTQVNTDSNLKVTYGNDLYVNRQWVIGATAELPVRTETFHGNGLNQSFTLSYPVSSISSITLNSVAQTVGTKGAAGDAWYYATGDPVIAQDTGGSPIGGGDTLDVTYKGRYPVRALAQNSALISAQKTVENGGTGYVESVYSNTNLSTLPAANQVAGALLSHYGDDVTVLQFNTLTGSALLEGQMLTVDLPDFDLNNMQMLITSVEITDSINESFNIWYRVTATGSPYEAAQFQTFWANLMNQSPDPASLQDVDDTSGLALLLQSTLTLTPTLTVTVTKTTCALVPATVPFTVC